MSENTRSKVQINQTLLNKVISQPLGKLVTNALTKLKNAWLQENTLSGIQFYGDMDDWNAIRSSDRNSGTG